MKKHCSHHYHTFLNKHNILNNLVLALVKTNPIGKKKSRLNYWEDCLFARIWLSLKQLVDKGHIEKIRFWGKIFGTQKNYYVAEAEQSVDGADDDEPPVEDNKKPEDNQELND